MLVGHVTSHHINPPPPPPSITSKLIDVGWGIICAQHALCEKAPKVFTIIFLKDLHGQ